MRMYEPFLSFCFFLFSQASETSLRIVLVDSTKQPRSYLIRVKMAAEAEATRAAINSHIPNKEGGDPTATV